MVQGYKDREDESVAERIRKPRTKRQLKASRDESYGKWGKGTGKGAIDRHPESKRRKAGPPGPRMLDPKRLRPKTGRPSIKDLPKWLKDFLKKHRPGAPMPFKPAKPATARGGGVAKRGLGIAKRGGGIAKRGMGIEK